MAGTRCVNPEYQLEVDTMMVEYVLYKSVDAHLQLLMALSRQTNPEESQDNDLLAEEAMSALRLTETYDSLIISYKKNHRTHLNENTQRNARILQFLVQLNSWIMNRIPELEDFTPHTSSDMQDQQTRDMLVNQSCRRIWLKANKELQASDHTESSDSWRLRNPRLCLADHLLPLFMWVSIDLFKVSMKPPVIGLEWMKLASHLMVQAAIEILDSPDLLASGPSVAREALQECFAWGSLGDSHTAYSIEAIAHTTEARGFPAPDSDGLHSVVSMEDSCQKMFKGRANIGRQSSSLNSLSGSQVPAWNTIKQEAAEDVLMTFTSIQEAGTVLLHRPLELLRNKYQLTALLTGISDFIAIHWRLLHLKKWHKKPILIQIEEGGIDGLTLEEFEKFKQRARIDDMWDSMVTDEESLDDAVMDVE